MNQTRHIARDEIEVDFGCPEEAAITEIEIAPDGRLFLFGASAQVLAALRDCGLADERLDLRIPVFTSTSSTPGTPLEP